MDARPRKIELYRTESNDAPFESWLLGLKDVRGRADIRVRLGRVEQGNLGDFEPVGDGVYELKIDKGPGYRVYFGQDGDSVVLLSGGDKGSQQRDIAKAKTYWSDYNA
jgi:putative addiction module killer protein